MNDSELLKRLESSHAYFMKKKEELFSEIEKEKQQLNSVLECIAEKEKYIEVQTKQEKDASNIFNLYDTTNQYTEQITQLKADLKKYRNDEICMKDRLDSLEKEFKEVNGQIISHLLMQKYLKEMEEKETAGLDKEQTIDEKEVSVQAKNVHSEEVPSKTTEDVVRRLQFCKDLITLDSKRCSLEMTMLINDLM